MGHRTTDHSRPVPSPGRGNRRTRSGPGRHNLRRASLEATEADIRICLGCDRPFRSRGPGNRLCDRCHELNVEYENVRSHPVPSEWPRSLFADFDEL